MNKDRQIEETANEIYETLMLEAECPLSGMDCAIIADLLVSKGYRKASEVALEIEKYILEGMSTIESNNSDAMYGAKFAIEKVVLPILEAYKKKHTGDGE